MTILEVINANVLVVGIPFTKAKFKRPSRLNMAPEKGRYQISQAHREVRIIKRKNKSEMTISAKESLYAYH